MLAKEYYDEEGGSPAHAGIDRSQVTFMVFSLGFPRTRGDRPASGQGSQAGPQVPPHTRG